MSFLSVSEFFLKFCKDKVRLAVAHARGHFHGLRSWKNIHTNCFLLQLRYGFSFQLQSRGELVS